MPTPIFTPYGPFQPLGLITVAAPNTPVPLTQNIGTYYSSIGKSEYSMNFNQIWVRASVANTGAIYLVSPGQPASNTDAIIWFLLPGEYILLGGDANARNTFDLNTVWIDAATAGNTAQVTGLVGG